MINKFETVFKGKTKELSEDGAYIWAATTVMESKGVPVSKEIKDSPMWYLPSIVQARIDYLKLPIKFTEHAYVCLSGLIKNPGEAMIVLIDALTKFEGQTIDVTKLSELYPFGFYTNDTVMDYIDNYLKTRKVKWAEIY